MKKIALIAVLVFSALQLAAQEPGENITTRNCYYAAGSGKLFHHPGWNEKMLGIYLEYRQEKLYNDLRRQYLLRSQRIQSFMVEANVPLWSLSALQYYYLPRLSAHSALYVRMNIAKYGRLPMLSSKVDPRLLRDVTGKHHAIN